MTDDYESMLDEAYKKIKPIEGKSDRFEIPKVNSIIEGKKTIVSNFLQISSYLRRNFEHLEKYLEKEFAAPGKIENERLILIKKIPQAKLNEKIENYVKEFVLCKECKKPDTEITKQDGFSFMHCLACGARYSVHKI
jgi:translation initiation factor 2 subunit 2